MKEETARNLQNYLKEDASYLECDKCFRKSYSERVNSNCNMLQTNGNTCNGILNGKATK